MRNPGKLPLITRAKIAIDLLRGQPMAASYIGAEVGRRSMANWRVSAGDANTDINPDLPVLRERSRDAIRNNPIALGVINNKTTSVVGTGMQINAQIDRAYLGLNDAAADEWESIAESEFNAWALDPDACDIERCLNFAELQSLAYRSTLENGDVFILTPEQLRQASPYTLKLQLIEADRCSNPNRGQDNKLISGGVEVDNFGAPVAYHITGDHPGMRGASLEWQRYDAFGGETGRRNVLHLFSKLRPGQRRGVPDLAPITETLKSLADYTKAELDAAVLTAFLGVVTKTEARTGFGEAYMGQSPAGDTKTDTYKMGPALVMDLKPGEDVTTISPNRPNPDFDPFFLAMLKQAGTALELPFEILIKHFDSSYSASRAALEDAKRFYMTRRVWLASRLCQPVYEMIITEAVMMGRLQAPGFFEDPMIRRAYLGSYREQWIGPGFAAIDPLKESMAYEIDEDRGWRTATEITAAKTGGDWTKKQRRRAKELETRAAMGAAIPERSAEMPVNPDE